MAGSVNIHEMRAKLEGRLAEAYKAIHAAQEKNEATSGGWPVAKQCLETVRFLLRGYDAMDKHFALLDGANATRYVGKPEFAAYEAGFQDLEVATRLTRQAAILESLNNCLEAFEKGGWA